MNDSPIVVAGSGRSGTTWVLDVIAQANGLRTVFEPLHPDGCPVAKSFANRYVRDDASEPELKLFMDRVMSGTLPSLWSNYRVRADRLRFSNLRKLSSLEEKSKYLYWNYKKLLIHYARYRKSRKFNRIIVKFIRANLMLGWLSTNYNAKIIFIVRHPCAVVSSKLSLGGPDWSHEGLLKFYLGDQTLWQDYLYKFNKIISKPVSKIECHTIIWCIENMIPLTHTDKKSFLTTFYEDLILNEKKEWKRIAEFLHLDVIPSQETISRPSQQASKKMKKKLFDSKQLSKWMKDFTNSELSEIDRILNYFQVTFYSSRDPKPIL